MLNTPEQELSHTDSESTDDLLTETPEVDEDATETGDKNSEEPEKAEEVDENEVYLVGDREISLAELKRLEDKAKNLEAGYTKTRQKESEEHKARISEAVSIANDLKAKADALEAFIDEDEKAVDWDSLSTSEVKEVEKKFRVRREELEKARSKAEQAGEKAKAERLVKTNTEVNSRFSDGWKDEKVKAKDLQNAYKYATSIGMTPDDVAQLTEPWQFIALIEAAKFNDIKTSTPEAKKKVKPAKKAVTKQSALSNGNLADMWYPD